MTTTTSTENGHRRKLRALPEPTELSVGDLQLEPLRNYHYDALYHLLVVEGAGWRYRFEGRTPTMEQFVGELTTGVGINMVIRPKMTISVTPGGPPPMLPVLGLLQIYGGSMRDGHGYLGVVLSPRVRQDARMSILLGKFCHHALITFGFRKLYAEMAEYTYRDVASGEGRFFEVEGILRDHYVRPGGVYDKYILAIRPEHVIRAVERKNQ